MFGALGRHERLHYTGFRGNENGIILTNGNENPA